jgi:hypothetical protein
MGDPCSACPQTFLVASAIEISAPFERGVPVPAPDIVAGPVVVTEAIGEATSPTLDLPPGLPSGTTLALQHRKPGPRGPAGFAASHAVRATVS